VNLSPKLGFVTATDIYEYICRICGCRFSRICRNAESALLNHSEQKSVEERLIFDRRFPTQPTLMHSVFFLLLTVAIIMIYVKCFCTRWRVGGQAALFSFRLIFNDCWTDAPTTHIGLTLPPILMKKLVKGDKYKFVHIATILDI